MKLSHLLTILLDHSLEILAKDVGFVIVLAYCLKAPLNKYFIIHIKY